MAVMMPSAFTPFEGCMSETYLGAAALTGSGSMRSRTMRLNGRELVLGEKDELPDLSGKTVSGELTVAPGGCTFIML